VKEEKAIKWGKLREEREKREILPKNSTNTKLRGVGRSDMFTD